MDTKNLYIFGVTVRGKHPCLISKRYFGLSSCIGKAIEMAKEPALADGWEEIQVEDVNRIGRIDFCAD